MTKLNIPLSLTDIVTLNDTINFEISQLTERNYNPTIQPAMKLENNERIDVLKKLKHRLIDTVVDSMIEETDD
jgi:hypothetical protein